MPYFQIDMMMNLNQNGFSEKYFAFAADSASAGTKALNLATRRSPLLSRNGSVIGWRITRLKDDTGLPEFRGFTTTAQDQPAGDPSTGTRDVRNVALIVRFGNPTVAAAAKTLYMRGFPDSSAQFEENGNPKFDNTFNTPFNTWRNYVTGNGYYIRLFETSDALNPKFTLASLEFNADGALILNLGQADSSIQAGDRIKLFKYRGLFTTCVNGVRTVQDRPSTTKILTDYKDKRFAGGTDAPGKAFIRKEKYGFVEITKASVVGWATRQTGRPFGSGAGRRKRRC